MDDFEDALRNIDIFCKVLVKKIIENESEENPNIAVEPIEKLLHRKSVVQEQVEPTSVKHFIPLSQAEEPLIDVFEDENHVRIFMQSRCKDERVTVRRDFDSIELCKRECHKDAKGVEICYDNCRKLDLSVAQLDVANIVTRCNNNEVFELDIPKSKS